MAFAKTTTLVLRIKATPEGSILPMMFEVPIRLKSGLGTTPTLISYGGIIYEITNLEDLGKFSDTGASNIKFTLEDVTTNVQITQTVTHDEFYALYSSRLTEDLVNKAKHVLKNAKENLYSDSPIVNP